MPPQERSLQADVAYAHGQISEGEWKSVKSNASKDQDARLGQFHQDATRLLLPDLTPSLKIPQLWELDKTTDRVMIAPDKQNPLKFGPQRDSGIDRTHTGPNGKPAKEHIYLGQITEALNIFRERMEIDPRYTPAAALADLKEFIRPATEEYAKSTAAEALSKQAWMNNTIRKNITEKSIRMTTPTPKTGK